MQNTIFYNLKFYTNKLVQHFNLKRLKINSSAIKYSKKVYIQIFR